METTNIYIVFQKSPHPRNTKRENKFPPQSKRVHEDCVVS